MDLFLDIRLGSPTFGKIAACEMAAPADAAWGEWIWLPLGFAHGVFFTVESRIEYLCSGAYNQACEAGPSPVTGDLDWSLCDAVLKGEFDALIANGAVLSEKDRQGLSLTAWAADSRAQHFTYEPLQAVK